MASIDPMYQYSLQWFTNLFIRTTQEADQADDQPGRLENLKNFFTYLLYDQVCRSLFEEHKLLFSYLMTIGLETAAGNVDDTEQRFLISGASLNPKTSENPAPEWITKRMWNEIQNLLGWIFIMDLTRQLLSTLLNLKHILMAQLPRTKSYLESGTSPSIRSKIRGFAVL